MQLALTADPASTQILEKDLRDNLAPMVEADLAAAEPALGDLRAEQRAPLARVARGELAPVIAERYPLDAKGAQAAHHYLQDRKNIGKVVLVR